MSRIASNYSSVFQIAILLLALLVAFGLFWLDREEPAYLWLGLACAVMLSIAVLNLVTTYTTWIGGNTFFLLEDAVLMPVTLGLWVLFWAYWFRLEAMARLHRMVWGLVVMLGIATAMLRAPLYGSLVPVHAIVWLSPLTLVLKLLLGVLLVWVTVRGIRKNRAEGWLALPAVLLVILSRYSEELAGAACADGRLSVWSRDRRHQCRYHSVAGHHHGAAAAAVFAWAA